MNDEQRAFIARLVETTGPSGYEQEAQELWRQRVSGVAAEVRTDFMGNAIAVLNPTGSPGVLLEAHIDEIGFQIRYIDENGFLYFNTIGGFDPATLAGNRVRINTRKGPVRGVIGRKPAHLLGEEDRKQLPKIKGMWIDIGAQSREEAQERVAVGDAGGRVQGFEQLHGSIYASNSFDDRIGSYVIAEAFRAVAEKQPKAAVYAVSAVQEEVGLRGAGPAAYGVNVPIGIAVDVTFTSDHPQTTVTETGETKVGAGPSISRGPNSNPHIVDALITAAERAGVPYQLDADPTGAGTDQYAIQVVRGGMATGLVSIPTRYLHTASEVLSMDDVDAAVQILAEFVLNLDDGINLRP